jgi:hypothetical protein
MATKKKELKEFRVAMCEEIGGAINIKAKSKREAERIAYDMVSENGIDDKFEIVHRNFFNA